MAIQVFVSHSHKDVEFCDIFDRACARVGVKAFRSEFESIELPAWKTITKNIRKSRALFLLFGRELAEAQLSSEPSWLYTQNWIAFEIGVACERGMDVWVICDDVRINFPVPYVNNYLTVSLRHREAFDYMVNILTDYAKGVKTTFPDKENVIECLNEDCGAIFNFPVPIDAGGIIVCPVCLREVEFPDGHLLVES
jgi:hypothetical protein